MKTISIILFFAILLVNFAFGQLAKPQVLPCTNINNASLSNGVGSSIFGYNCVSIANSSIGESEISTSGSYISIYPNTLIRADPNKSVKFHFNESRNFEVGWFEPANSIGTVMQYDMLEIGMQLPAPIQLEVTNYINKTAPSTNPFNPQDLDIQAYFINPNGKTVKAFGYYIREMQRDFQNNTYADLMANQNPYDMYFFRFRIAPEQLGTWRLQKIEVYWKGSYFNAQKIESTFNCVPNTNADQAKGYMKVGNNKKYFTLSETGETFFPVGRNLQWPVCWQCNTLPGTASCLSQNGPGAIGFPGDGAYCSSLTDIKTPWLYFEYINELKNFNYIGANYFRMIMNPMNLDMEWEEIGNYYDRQFIGYEMDNILKFCEDNGLKIHLNLQIHFAFEEPSAYTMTHWDWIKNTNGNNYNGCTNAVVPNDKENPYKTAWSLNRGSDFLWASLFSYDNEYFNKLRYIFSRWGYSNAIGVVELFSEINQIGNLIPYDDNLVPQNPQWCVSAAGNSAYDQYKYAPYFNEAQVRRDVANWQHSIAGWLKAIMKVKNPIAVSYAGKPNQDKNYVFTYEDWSYASPNIDVATYNAYETRIEKFAETDFLLKKEYRINHKLIMNNILQHVPIYGEKPFMHSEFGADDGLEGNCDKWVEQIRAIWMTPFTGLAAMGLLWNQRNQYSNKPYNYYLPVKNFIAGYDFNGSVGGSWVPQTAVRADKKADMVALVEGLGAYGAAGKRSAIGVINNRTVNFYSLADPNTACRDPKFIDNDTIIQNGEVFINNRIAINVSSLNVPNADEIRLQNMGNFIRYNISYYNIHTLAQIGVSVQKRSHLTNGTLLLEYPTLEDDVNENFMIAFKVEPVNDNSSRIAPEEQDSLPIIYEEPELPKEMPTFELQPNPANNNVTIIHNSNEQVALSIYNNLGMLIETKDINSSIMELDISYLKKGYYFFVLKTNEQTLTKKLIKM